MTQFGFVACAWKYDSESNCLLSRWIHFSQCQRGFSMSNWKVRIIGHWCWRHVSQAWVHSVRFFRFVISESSVTKLNLFSMFWNIVRHIASFSWHETTWVDFLSISVERRLVKRGEKKSHYIANRGTDDITAPNNTNLADFVNSSQPAENDIDTDTEDEEYEAVTGAGYQRPQYGHLPRFPRIKMLQFFLWWLVYGERGEAVASNDEAKERTEIEEIENELNVNRFEWLSELQDLPQSRLGKGNCLRWECIHGFENRCAKPWNWYVFCSQELLWIQSNTLKCSYRLQSMLSTNRNAFVKSFFELNIAFIPGAPK